MKQEEFLTSFQEALTGNVPDRMIQDNMIYYRSYINKQLQNGKTEEDVLRSLGNPRLLAKTIIDTNKFASENEQQSEQDSLRQDYSGYQWRNQEQKKAQTHNKKSMKTLQLPSWLVGILCVFAMVLLVGLAFCVVSHLAPILFTIAISVLGYRAIRKAIRGY